MNKELTVIGEIQLGVDICPHSLRELAIDIQDMIDEFDGREEKMVIEDGWITVYGEAPKPKAVVFDSDEVLLNWPVGFVEWHNKKYGTTVPTHNGVDYDVSIENAFGIPHEVLEPRMSEFNNSTWEFGCLPAMQYAKTGIEYIVQHNARYPDDKIHIIVVTKCGSADHVRNMRIANLVNTFGDVFTDIITLDIKDSKVPALQAAEAEYNVLMFVDDFFKNIEQVRDATNIPCFALRAPHNKHLPFPANSFMCNHWSDLFAEIVSVTDNM